MFGFVRWIAAAGCLALAPPSASGATLYAFSFSNLDGGVGGTVVGTITLPDGDGTFAATAISITAAPSALGYTLPFDPVSWGAEFVNTFTVTGGAIDKAASSFAKEAALGTAAHTAFSLNYLGYGSLLNTIGSGYSSGVQDTANTTLSYSAVPEPASLGLLALGAAALAAARRCRRTGLAELATRA